MQAKLYIDKGRPLIALEPQKLTDGSVVWNLHLRGGQEDHEIIHCVSEKRGDEAFALMAKAVEVAAGEKPLIL